MPAIRKLVFLSLLAATGPALAAEITLTPVEVTETKALFGQIESRYVVPARSRIGGTVTALDISEGDTVEAGQVIARIVDEKLDLQLAAADARLAAAKSELENAQTELTRSEALLDRSATTTQAVDRIRTSLTVARNAVAELESGRAVILQQMAEGDVIAPSAGRVLSLPTRHGEVVMAGEAVAAIAGGNVFLRLAIPERHAEGLIVGAAVDIGDDAAPRQGKVEKIFPLIENGRVTVDVAVEGLPDTFIGKRVLVRVQIGTRLTLAVPEAAVQRSAGLDLVNVVAGDVTRSVAVVPGAIVTTAKGPLVEILSGLRSGDMVIVP